MLEIKRGEEFNPELLIILNKMCESINIDINTIDFQKEDWYLDHSWSNKQQADFVIWLSDLLYKNMKVRNSIMRVPIKDKKLCLKAAEFFTAMFTWKTHKEVKEELDTFQETK